MLLINNTKKIQISENIEVAGSWLSRFKGLMGRRVLPLGHCLILTPCNSIHTCFMRFNIDALFVDKEGVVVHLIKNLSPYKCSAIIKNCKYVIELPPGTVDRTGTTVKDTLNICDVI